MGTIYMIVIALAMFGVIKAITFSDYKRTARTRPTLRETFFWYCCWPGMNTSEFFSAPAAGTAPPSRGEWTAAAAKTSFGIAVLVGPAPYAIGIQPLLGGWIAMLGIIFTMHFGAFHVIALAWRKAGRNVRPIMNAPILAQSLMDFWSHRWNLAFRDFARGFVLAPLTKWFSAPAAAFGCFVFSGIVHDIVISIPAGGGYGLPTAYFLFQGVAAAFERSKLGARLGLRRGIRGRAFTLLCTAGPAFWLFHPAFVYNVINPIFS